MDNISTTSDNEQTSPDRATHDQLISHVSLDSGIAALAGILGVLALSSCCVNISLLSVFIIRKRQRNDGLFTIGTSELRTLAIASV